MSTDRIRTRTSEVYVSDDGILYAVFLPGAEEKLSDAQEGLRIARRLAGGRRIPVLVDLRSIKSQDRDARAYYNSPDALQTTSAVALLTGSRISTLIANFFLSISTREETKQSRPIRMFSNEGEAIAWLKGFVQ